MRKHGLVTQLILIEWLASTDKPNETYYISLDLDSLPEIELNKTLNHLGLKLKRGFKETEIISIYGQPKSIYEASKDKKH